MAMSMQPARLRKMIGEKRMIVAPGAFDALSARLIEQAGFSALYVTGAGVASSRLGVPDIGLTTMTEMLDAARNIVNAVGIPVICDMDTGYGNALNLMRAVREFEAAGAAALQIEDQVTPKRCGHTEGKQLIEKAEMIQKIRAFQEARRSRDLVLIARTDAIAVEGFENAVERARAYVEAGADVLFVEAPKTIEEMKCIVELLPDVPLLVNMVDGGKTPMLPAPELEAMGFKIAIYPTTAWTAAIKAMQRVLGRLNETGDAAAFDEDRVSFETMFEIVGRSQYQDLEKKFLRL
jgi:carboxyvinyl-carboxyphosphonate phosphorylmutase